MAAPDKRRDRRLTLTLPVRVTGHDPAGKPWDEMASTIDVSVRGCATTLQHKVQIARSSSYRCRSPGSCGNTS